MRGQRPDFASLHPGEDNAMLVTWSDAEAIVRVALAAFAQFGSYSDWPFAMSRRCRASRTGEIMSPKMMVTSSCRRLS